MWNTTTTNGISWPVGVATCVAVAATTRYLKQVWDKKQNDRYLAECPSPPSSSSSSSSSSFKNPQTITVLVVGGGTIGSGFASVFLAKGMKVILSDPNASQETVQSRIRKCWPSLKARGLTDLKEPPFDSFQKVENLEDISTKMNQEISFVQECVFEDVDIKQSVLAELDRLVDPSVLIASSTSFIPWPLLFSKCQHKYRLMIGHPSMPDRGCFMEIYGISPPWTTYCREWYTTRASFDVIVIKKTIPGHVFNSFLALNLEHGHKLERQGVCSPEDINTALRHLSRGFYGQHLYLSLLTVIGGDRGFEGGKVLGQRIRNDAAYLIIFSSMKQKGYPDIMAKPIAKHVGRFIVNHVLPGTPEEYLEAAKVFDDKVTKGGTIPPQEALLNRVTEVYKSVPFEVDNDPLGVQY